MHRNPFITFLESLRTPKNISTIKAIHEGHQAIYESIVDKVTFGKEPTNQTYEQATAYIDNKEVGSLIYELDFPEQGQINIEYLKTIPEHRNKGVAGSIIKKMKEKYPTYKLSGRSTNATAEHINHKHDIIDRTVNDRYKMVKDLQDGIKETEANIANGIAERPYQRSHSDILNIQQEKLQQVLARIEERKPITESLEQEAKNFTTADEFVKSKVNMFHKSNS